MNCTFIGLGNLGKELCGRIGLAGFHTFAYDLNPDASKNAAEKFKNIIQSDLTDAVKQSGYFKLSSKFFFGQRSCNEIDQ